MLIAALQHGLSFREDPAHGLVSRSSLWIVGDGTHFKADGQHLLKFRLLVRD